MWKPIVYIFLLINLGHFVTAQCELTIADLENKVLTSIQAPFCNPDNCLQGDASIKFVHDIVRISAVKLKSLVETKNGFKEVSSETPKSQNTLNINLNFLVGSDQNNYNLINSCANQNINGRNQTKVELKHRVGPDKYQIFTFSISSQESSNDQILMFQLLIFVFAFYIIYI